jgi:hypothetical protein
MRNNEIDILDNKIAEEDLNQYFRDDVTATAEVHYVQK